MIFTYNKEHVGDVLMVICNFFRSKGKASNTYQSQACHPHFFSFHTIHFNTKKALGHMRKQQKSK